MRPTTEGKGEKRDMAEDLRVPLSQVPGSVRPAEQASVLGTQYDWRSVHMGKSKDLQACRSTKGFGVASSRIRRSSERLCHSILVPDSRSREHGWKSSREAREKVGSRESLMLHSRTYVLPKTSEKQELVCVSSWLFCLPQVLD
jgi:hypothetical protein